MRDVRYVLCRWEGDVWLIESVLGGRDLFVTYLLGRVLVSLQGHEIFCEEIGLV
jgi:hypothetical protein